MAKNKRVFSIGEFAATFDCTHRALRLYAEKDLLQPIRVRNIRYFSADDAKRMAFIEDAKRLGFCLAEIKRMMADQAQDGSASLRIPPEMVDRQITFIERQRAALEAQLSALRQSRTANRDAAGDET